MNSKEPLDFWEMYFEPEFLPKLVSSANSNAENDGSPERFTVQDARGFVIIDMAMGLVRLHDQNDYWSTDTSLQGLFPSGFFSNIMPRNRYKLIKKYMVLPRSEGTKIVNRQSRKFWNSAQFVDLPFIVSTPFFLRIYFIYIGR